MAIPHAHVGVGKKGKAAPHADYIMREGKYAEYAERKGDHLVAVESGNMPAWAVDNPREFWKAADHYERANGSTYREFEFALPRELDRDQRLALVRDWAEYELGDKHAYTFAIHEAKAADGGIQPHVHMMFSERQQDGIERSPEQYFKRANKAHPERGGCAKGYGKNAGKTLTASERREELKALRGRWQSVTNLHLRRAGHEASEISLLSYKDRRMLLDVTPEPKMKAGEWHKPNSPKRDAVIAIRAERAAKALEKQERIDRIQKVRDVTGAVINSNLKRKELSHQFSEQRRNRWGLREDDALDICSQYNAIKERERLIKNEAFSENGYVKKAENTRDRVGESFYETERELKGKGIFWVLSSEGRSLNKTLESKREQYHELHDEYSKQYDNYEAKLKPIIEERKALQPEYDQAKAFLNECEEITQALEKIEGTDEHYSAVARERRAVKEAEEQKKQAAENAKKAAKEAAERKIREEQIKDAARRRGVGGMKM